MEKVYRFEDKFGSGIYCSNIKELRFLEEDTINQLLPHEDKMLVKNAILQGVLETSVVDEDIGKLLNKSNYFYGFSSIHQILNWFSTNHLHQLFNTECVLTVHTCLSNHIIKGDAQVAFKKDKVIEVKKYDFSKTSLYEFLFT